MNIGSEAATIATPTGIAAGRRAGGDRRGRGVGTVEQVRWSWGSGIKKASNDYLLHDGK